MLSNILSQRSGNNTTSIVDMILNGMAAESLTDERDVSYVVSTLKRAGVNVSRSDVEEAKNICWSRCQRERNTRFNTNRNDHNWS